MCSGLGFGLSVFWPFSHSSLFGCPRRSPLSLSQYSIPKSKYGQMPMLLREDQLQVGRMRQLQNNKRRAEKKASRALFGDVAGSAVAASSAAGSGRAPAAAATRSLVEASAFAAEKVVARTEEIEFGFGRRNPNAQRGGGKRR